ncbi:Zn(II)2Cys6 transcription factor [Macrophomina phaseolina]|uniref:Zn(II)2Cys6 transcription factor n=1 Tax=Macrophomina phaseolina TaxID=35725 RepID=A0ABQ8FWC7_9PEZI|nr:Zn(II)2Cys6 transcription factor [Macrophomina phaseolina]
MPHTPLAKRSCSRCHAKKIKCNRGLPQCGPCLRSQQTCLYEQRKRTPLTRKYLTQVEHQLAEARALVQRYASETGIGEVPEVQEASWRNGSNEPSVSSLTISAEHQTVHPQPGDPASALDLDGPLTRIDALASRAGLQYPRSQSAAGGSRAALSDWNATSRSEREQNPTDTKAITFPLERTPASVSGNLEWDERNVSRHGRLNDGMGNLTEGVNEGYLGVASGASFLRLTELDQLPENGDAGPSHTGSRDSPVPHLRLPPPPPSRLDTFLDDYFALYHPSYPIIHEASFRAEYMEVIPRPPGALWHVLLYVVAALGACTSGKYQSGMDVVLFEEAKSRLSFDILETGSMMLVQVLALVANYVQKANKPNSGYNYLGLAKRVAVGIGLHREYSDWTVTPWQVEMRRRVWWCLVIFDVGASITFSRPIELPTGVDIGLPRNFRDTDLTRPTEHLPPEAAETTVYTNIRCQALFDLAIKDVYSALTNGAYPSPETLIHLDDSKIGQWLAELPSYFQEEAPQPAKFTLCHTILHLRWRNFKIIMYRPFVIRSAILQNKKRAAGTDQESSEEEQLDNSSSAITLAILRCLEAAADTITKISSFWFSESNKNPMACWYGIFFLFQAVIIPIVSLRNEPQSQHAEEWRSQIQQAVRTLEDMMHVNATAARCLRVISRLCGPFLLEDEMMATDESPQTQLNNLNSLFWPLDSTQFEYGSVSGDRGISDFFNQLPGFQWN